MNIKEKLWKPIKKCPISHSGDDDCLPSYKQEWWFKD